VYDIAENTCSLEGPGSLLDIGCAEGFYVHGASDLGWVAWGVEGKRLPTVKHSLRKPVRGRSGDGLYSILLQLFNYAEYYNEISINNTQEIQELSLKQNYPNPFNPTTTIEFSIPKSEFITLKIYNLLGQEVATLVSEKLTQGTYTFTWDATDFASGLYYYQMTSSEFQMMKKMIVIK